MAGLSALVYLATKLLLLKLSWLSRNPEVTALPLLLPPPLPEAPRGGGKIASPFRSPSGLLLVPPIGRTQQGAGWPGNLGNVVFRLSAPRPDGRIKKGESGAEGQKTLVSTHFQGHILRKFKVDAHYLIKFMNEIHFVTSYHFFKPVSVESYNVII